MEQALLEVATFQTEATAAVAAIVVGLEGRTSSGLELGPPIGKTLRRTEEPSAWAEDFGDFGDYAAAAAVGVVLSEAGLGWE